MFINGGVRTEQMGISLWDEGGMGYATRRAAGINRRPVESTLALNLNTSVGAPATHAHIRFIQITRRSGGENLWMDVVMPYRYDDNALHYTARYRTAAETTSS